MSSRKSHSQDSFLAEVAKYAMVGVLNITVDLAVLNAQILLIGIATGSFFVVFKLVSSLAASLNSFWWNKKWTFKSTGRRQISKFYLVICIGGCINILTATYLVGFSPENISPHLWANIASATGTICGGIFGFFGSKYFVFRDRKFVLVK